ncbi:MAG: hypothetical protein DRI84_03975 [Bacteroidetes bacterium]|nr:MAG: hypothetical protein DRI84_03975 [Bacteroidota bacterium]
MKHILKVIGFVLISFFFIGNTFGQSATFNYNTSTGNVGTGYSWIDCSGGTEITTFSSGDADDGRQEINWPFAFRFYDNNYTTSNQLSIGTSGFIRLNGLASTTWQDASNYDLTSTATSFGQIIALCVYDDNFEDGSSHLYYLTTGTSPNRVLTIEFDNVEIDYNDNRFANAQVSFYESSNKVVIKLGTDNINKGGVDIGLHSGVNTFFNKWQEVQSGTNNTWIEYTIPAKALNSITYNQASTADVYPGQIDAEILRMDVNVAGGTGTLILNSIQITANNDNNADIASSGVKLYRTTTTTFSTANLLGTAQSLSGGTATFSSLSYDLPGGINYIWAVYDIAATGVLNRNVDMTIATNAINIAASTYPSSSQSPAGNRTIVFIEWDGSTDTDWTDGANWTGGSEPGTTDHIRIPSAPTNQPILSNGNTGNCASITINSGASVTITGSGRLYMYGNLINNGSIIQTSGLANNKLFGSIGNNYIKGTGTYTLVRLRIDGDTYYSESDILDAERFVVANGGKFYLGTQTLRVNDFRMKLPGDDFDVGSGTLEIRTNAIEDDGDLICGTNSTVYFSGTVAQTIPSQYTYYHLKAGGNATKTPDGNLDVNGDLTIESGSTLSQGGTVNVAGDWSNSGTFTQGTQTVTFDGASSQTISGSTTTTFYNMTVNNTGGITLSRTANVSNTLTLTSGIVNSTSTNPLVFTSAATAFSGGSSTSHIDGPTQKVGSGNFIFPTGDGGKYARIGISALSGTETFTAQYNQSTPTNNTSFTYPITKVSDNEYWDLSRTGASVSATVTLYWEDSQWSGIGSFADLRIMHYGTAWTAESGTYSNTGSVGLSAANAGSLSVTSVSTFSPFSFGTIDNINNPLPIDLLSFDAQIDGDVVIVNWSTASELNNDYFIIERSKDGITSERIGIVEGAGNSNNVLDYDLIDFQPYGGTSYYRLIQVDYDGQMETFDWVSVKREVANEATVDIFPNPVSSGELNLQFNNILGQTEITIYDLSGRKVYQENQNIDYSSQQIQLFLDLPKGSYTIQIISRDGIKVKKLIVN